MSNLNIKSMLYSLKELVNMLLIDTILVSVPQDILDSFTEQEVISIYKKDGVIIRPFGNGNYQLSYERGRVDLARGFSDAYKLRQQCFA